MAQIIDLGKLRFTYTGAWSSGESYEFNDVVSYGGNLYIWKDSATSSPSDIPTNTEYWDLIVRGFNYVGNWNGTFIYRPGDVVNDGARLYLAILDIPSNAADILNDDYWMLLVDGIRYRGAFSGSTNYKLNDVVSYGGSVYIVTVSGISSGTPATDGSHFTKFVDGTYPNQAGLNLGILQTDGTSASWQVDPTLDSFTALNTTYFGSQAQSFSTGLTSPSAVFDIDGDSNAFAQVAFRNRESTSSSDVIVYADNGTDAAGWIDMGITGSQFDQSTYGITGTNDGYIFVEAPASSTLTVTNKFFSAGSATITTSANHNIKAGNQVIISGVGAPFNGTWTTTGTPTLTAFTFAIPSITKTITNKALTGNVATLTTSVAHGFLVGDSVVITGIDVVFNGTYTITSTTSTTFNYARTNTNVVSVATTGTAVATHANVSSVASAGTVSAYKGFGNLVLATGDQGSQNSIIFAAGGYDTARKQMQIWPDTTVNIAISTDSTSTTTGALTVSGGAGIAGTVNIGGSLVVAGQVDFSGVDFMPVGPGAKDFAQTLTNPTVVAVTDHNNYAQIAHWNQGTGTSSSTDFIAYPDNGADSAGFIDMGITSSNFSDPAFTITGANDGYIFMSAPAGTSGKGNLVLATDTTGTQNRIIFAAGGYSTNRTQMTIIPDTKVDINISTASTSATSGALTVAGGVGISGNLNVAGNVAIVGNLSFGGGTTTTANLAVTNPLVFTGDGALADTSELGIVGQYEVAISTVTATVTNKALTSNVATLTTSSAHTFLAGDVVVVSGVDVTFNGTFSVTSVPTSTTFTYAKTATNVSSTSSAGTAAVSLRAKYFGIARDHSDGVVKLFTAASTKPTSIVDFTQSGLLYADLKAGAATFTGAITGGSTSNITINTNKFTVAAATGNIVTAGTITGGSASDIAINTNKFTVAASTGNTVVGGTLGVTGNTTLSGTLTGGSTSDIAINTNKFTVSASTGNVTVGGSLTYGGNISAPAWTTTGIRHISGTSTLTDTTSSGTVAAAYTNTFGTNVTIAASNPTTFTTYANTYIGLPTAGANVTITNAYSMITQGAVSIGGAATIAGNTTLSGSLTGGSSSNITINTNKFTVDATTGNTAVAGTLGVTGNATFSGDVTIVGALKIQEMAEDVVDTSMTSNAVTLDYSTGNVFWITSSPSAAMTWNVTNAPSTNGKVFTISAFVTQGSTGYIPSTFQIGGASQTIKWITGTAPTPTSSSGKIDIFNFTCIYRGSAWTILGNMTPNF